MDLTVFEQEVAEWSKKNWPGAMDVHRCMTKITEELGEIGRALIRNESVKVLESEAADVVITVQHLLWQLGGSLEKGLDEKWPVVRDRDPHERHKPEKAN